MRAFGGRNAWVFWVTVVFSGAERSPAVAPPSDTACLADRWETLVRDHVSRYSAMEISDLYKLLHQATLGSEHAVVTGEAAAWLAEELQTLGGGPAEPVVDPLGATGRLARIHLRPFVSRGGDPERLLTAFVATANRGYGDREALECAIGVVRRLAEAGSLPWPAGDVLAYLADRAADGYPAVHHSLPYQERHRPAYRVIASELIETIGLPPER